MGLGKVLTRVQLGLNTALVTTEASVGTGLPRFSIIGLASTDAKESRERVHSAIISAGFTFPAHRVVVNLAPANLMKIASSQFDLPIALAILVASRQLVWPKLELCEFLGELGLDGSLHAFPGAAILAKDVKASDRVLVTASANLAEISVIDQLKYLAINNLRRLAALTEQPNTLSVPAVAPSGAPSPGTPPPPVWFNQVKVVHLAPLKTKADKPALGGASSSGAAASITSAAVAGRASSKASSVATSRDEALAPDDLANIYRQVEAKRALEIAAAGGLNLLLMGPPGSGKSMLARSAKTILPPLSYNEALENLMLYTIFEHHQKHYQIEAMLQPPFRHPHHSASLAAIIGGANPPVPGEISLANHGVLFLDELLEFPRTVLEALREPLEERSVTISRSGFSFKYPCDCQLIVAMNPCPCGNWGHPKTPCCCSIEARRRYRQRLSGPLLDRLDLWVWVPPILDPLVNLKVPPLIAPRPLAPLIAPLAASPPRDATNVASLGAETSYEVLLRVAAARKLAFNRQHKLNAALNPAEIIKTAVLGAKEQEFLNLKLARHVVSMRSLHRILKIALTIADLANSPKITTEHLLEALSYRQSSLIEARG